MQTPTAMAVGAHPDDIEFLMAGTLLLLRAAGFEIHYLTLASGNCGSVQYDGRTTAAVRRKEARAACRVLDAHFHPALTHDLEILYELNLLRRLTGVIREVQPSILLVPSPQDYMEDHANTSRLAVSAAFGRGAPNWQSRPSRAAMEGEITLYHAMPQGLRDPLRQRIRPGAYVNTAAVQARKREALACHRSQKEWLDVSQGMDSYLRTMDEMAAEVGRMSGRFKVAEGWRRHLHYGFCGPDTDPLRKVLGSDYRIDRSYERALERPI